MIKCKKCLEEKSEAEFHPRKESPTGYRSECKPCRKKQGQEHRIQKKDQISARRKEYYSNNRDVILNKEKTRYEKKATEIKQKSLDYYYKNKEKVNTARRSYQKRRLESDPVFKITRNIRNRLWYALDNKSWKKSSKFHDYIGLDDYDQLKVFLEKNFTPEMSWDNYGDYWDIDHIVPLSLAKTQDALYKLQNYRNLFPREKIENRNLKRDRFNFNSELTVKLIDYNLGQDFLLENHYLRRKAPSEYTFGLFLPNGVLCGVCTFHTPFSPGLRSICGNEFSNQVIELNRLAVLDFLPTNTESWFIARCLNSKLIEKNIIVTFAEIEAGHSGIIYQACNFKYLGITEKRKDMSLGDSRHAMTLASSDIDKSSENFKYIDRKQKHRYIYFNGDKRQNKHYKECLKYDVLSFPKD